MLKWNDYFKIKETILAHKIKRDSEQEYILDQEYSMFFEPKYEIIEISTSKVIGTYKDYKYAIKQARYKYKKIITKIDKILLS